MFYLPDSLDNHYATALKMQKWQTVSQGLPSRFYNQFFGTFFRSGCLAAPCRPVIRGSRGLIIRGSRGLIIRGSRVLIIRGSRVLTISGRSIPDGRAGLSHHLQHRLQGIPPENVIGHFIHIRRDGIEADASTRHFDHTDVILPVADCHGICQTDAKTV